MAGAVGGMNGDYQGTSLAGIILASTSLLVGFINAIVFALKTRAEQERLDMEAENRRARYQEKIESLERLVREHHLVTTEKAGQVESEVSKLSDRLEIAEAETERLSRCLNPTDQNGG